VNDDELAAFLENGSDDEPGGTVAARELRDLLADETVWDDPSPGGADALLAAIRAEQAERPEQAPQRERADQALQPGAPSRPPAAAPSPTPGRAGRAPRPAWRRPALLAAAAVLLVVAGLTAGFLAGSGRNEAGGTEFAIAGTDLAPAASAVATVEDQPSGVRIELDVQDLGPAAPGTYYQAWVKGPDGLVTIGTFHMRGGDDVVDLWAGVDLERYPTLTVTLQQEGGGQESSGRVVLSGDIGSTSP